MTGSISQVQTDGQLGLFENLLPPRCYSATLFHKPVSFPLRLERVNRWERIASRRRPAFSSHLRNGGWSQWVDATLAQSLLGGVYKADFVCGRQCQTKQSSV